MLGEGEWKTKKHDADYRRQWRKVHLGTGASTLEIRAMEVTDKSIGDAPVLPALLNQISADERIASVSGDSAYDTRGRTGNMEKMERLPPARPCRNQDALLQAAGRTRHGTRLRAPGRRATSADCRAEPLHSAGYSGYGPDVIKRTTDSVSSAITRFAQQSPSKLNT